jgi:ABC-2 type transport system ATP-binding protein
VAVRLEGIGKRYGYTGPWIVCDFTADIQPAQLIRVDGENGSGKTTLLRVLAGVCEPSRGRVSGRPRTGYVPERFPPALPFTPRGYLTRLGRVHGVGGRELARRVRRVAGPARHRRVLGHAAAPFV